MTRRISCIFAASLLLVACDGGDAPARSAAPAPTRGYQPTPAGAPPAREVGPPRPAAPLDPAEVTLDQPENVLVNP